MLGRTMVVIKPGDRVAVKVPVYRNPVAATGQLASPGDIVTVLEWVNAGTMKVRRDSDGAQFLHRILEATSIQPE